MIFDISDKARSDAVSTDAVQIKLQNVLTKLKNDDDYKNKELSQK